VRLFLLTRHAQSTLNAAGRINGDPGVPGPLTEQGISEAERLGTQLAGLPLDLCVHTRFERTRETAVAILGDRDAELLEEPLLDDIDVGALEGDTVAAYRAWKAEHPERDHPFPDGESLDDAARRYAAAFRRLLARDERTTLVVCHEIPIRYALNGSAGAPDLDAPAHAIPNATPYLFDADSLARAAAGIERVAGPAG
jgi:broad specificity phosphatase PhoE